MLLNVKKGLEWWDQEGDQIKANFLREITWTGPLRENSEGLSIGEPSVNIGKEVCESMKYKVPDGEQGVVIKGNEAEQVGGGQMIQCEGQSK